MTTPRTTRITMRRPVVAVIAPPVAALFATTLVWTAGHEPGSAVPPGPVAAGPAAPSSSQELRRELAAQAASVRALAATVRTLRRRLASAGSGAPVAATSRSAANPSRAPQAGTAPTSAPTTAARTVPPAAPPPPPPPPPPPTTHATTRSS